MDIADVKRVKGGVMGSDSAGLSVYGHGEVLEIGYLVGMLYFFFCRITIIIIVVARAGVERVFWQQVVLIDIEEIGLEFCVAAGIIGVVTEEDPGVEVIVAKIFYEGVADGALVDGIVTAIPYCCDAIKGLFTWFGVGYGGGEGDKIIIRASLQGVFEGADGIIIFCVGLEAFQLHLVFGDQDGVF